LAHGPEGSPRQGAHRGTYPQRGLGNFGDAKPVGAGVFEMRIPYGPGFRVNYVRRGEVTYLLLCGGDKSSQTRDIQRAKSMAASLDGIT
jgi:putative addiction module killer protein